MDFPRGLIIAAIVLGALLGGAAWGPPGLLAGGAAGAIVALLIHLNQALNDLRQRVERLEASRRPAESAGRPAPSPEEGTGQPVGTPAAELQAARETEPEAVSTRAVETRARAAARPRAPSQGPAQPDVFSKYLRMLFEYLTTGNLVVKVAVLVLFVGVGFLLKYAADREILPIELRLAAVFVAGVAGLVIGWRLRTRNPGYALVLQGGSLGVLYLTVFAAAKLYSVIPLPLAFAVMVILIVCSAFLAVLQNSMALAVFGLAGGFLAPILTSSGTGNHVVLFSYFALLNFGVFGIAWYRSWRLLNLLGFFFTFLITSAWVAEAYTPARFPTTEPFLAIFFLQYLAISVLYAHKQPPDVRGWVDGSLVFGLPLVTIALHSVVVSHFEYGMAFSALGLSACYLIVTRLLWNNLEQGMPALTEAMAALSLIFATMAIPFALDGHWTAASWSIEGAALIWLGLRQHRFPARAFGAFLYVMSGLAYWVIASAEPADIPVFNSAFIGCLMVSVAGLFASYRYAVHRQDIRRIEKPASAVLMAIALVWWFASGLDEIAGFLDGRDMINLSVVFIAASFAVLTWLSLRLGWLEAAVPPMLHIPVAFTLLGYAMYDVSGYNPLAGWSSLAWAVVIGTGIRILRMMQESWPRIVLAVSHAVGLYLLILVLNIGFADFVAAIEGLGRGWADAVSGIVPAAVVAAVLAMRRSEIWPFRDYAESYFGAGIMPIAAALLLWNLAVSFSRPLTAPLPYIPILNPHDMAQLITFVLLAVWLYLWPARPARSVWLMGAVAVFAFVWLNSIVADSVHHYFHVGFYWSAMSSSAVFQTLVSILWTVCAFVIMALAVRFVARKIWYVGALLLAMVVVKLFMVDLADIGTIARIVSFLSVGGLMLLIGYLYPIPPSANEAETS